MSIISPAPLDQILTINLILYSPNCIKTYADSVINGNAPHLTHESYDDLFAAKQEDIDTVVNFANDNNLTVVDTHASSRTIKVSGTVETFTKMFGIMINTITDRGETYTDYLGNPVIPQEIANVVEHVIGFTDRAVFRTHAVMYNPDTYPSDTNSLTSLTPQQVATAYNFPNSTGAGQCIAILELGGGYVTSDLTQSFGDIGLSPPTIVDVLVDGATNAIGGRYPGDSVEVMLDIFVAGGVAPDAKIAVYFAPNSTQGFIDVFNAAVHDTVNNPSVISVSWANTEKYNGQNASVYAAFNSVFQAAVTKGITICVSSGDSGSTEQIYDGPSIRRLPFTVDFPASSPYILACGGTALSLNSDNSIANEYVWNRAAAGHGASGGGISSIYSLPSYQSGLSYNIYSDNSVHMLTTRGVPDVAGNADPASCYTYYYGGNTSTVQVGGTSAVSPLYAGMIARINSLKNNRVGFVNPLLYNNTSSFSNITTGNNVFFNYPKLDIQISPYNPAQLYTGTTAAYLTTATSYYFNGAGSIFNTGGPFILYEVPIGNSKFINTVTTGTITSTNIASISLACLPNLTFSSSSNFIDVAVTGIQGQPSWAEFLLLDPGPSSGQRSSTGPSLIGNITWVGSTPYVAVGNTITITNTFTNCVGQQIAIEIFHPDNTYTFLALAETISSSPKTYSTSVSITIPGTYLISTYSYPFNSGGNYILQNTRIIAVDSSEIKYLQPGPPIPDGYNATPGWDPVTGLGSPNGTAIANLINYSRGYGQVWPHNTGTRQTSGMVFPRPIIKKH